MTTLAARTGAAAIWPPSAERSGSETASAAPGDRGREHRPGDDRLGDATPTRPRELRRECVPDAPEPERREQDCHGDGERRQRSSRQDAHETPDVAAGDRLTERRAHP